MHNLVEEVWFLVEEQLEDRYKGRNVLHLDISRGPSGSILARLQKYVAVEVVLEDQGILVASAVLSDIEEIEAQELRDTSRVNLLTE